MSLATSNAFSALDTKRKKKSSKSKDDSGPKKAKAPSKEDQAAQLERAIFSQPATAGVSNWADTDDEDSFDGGGFGAPPPAWLQNAPPEPDSAQQPADEGPESEEDDHEDIENELGIEVTKEADEDEEEKSEADADADADAAESTTTEDKQSAAPLSRPVLEPIPPERQLSKKEQKAKGMEELNAVLAELGLEPAATGDAGGDGEAQKTKKERKKKKPAEDAHPNGKTVEAAPEAAFVAPSAGPNAEEPESEAEPADVVDPAEAKRLLAKKKAAGKKAASGSAAAAAAAAKEAKDRAKKKGKSKDSSHYNQAPTR